MSENTKDNIKAILFFAAIIGFFAICIKSYQVRSNEIIEEPTISVFQKGEQIKGTSVYFRHYAKNKNISVIELDDGRYYITRTRIKEGKSVELKAHEYVTVVSKFKDDGKFFALRTDTKYEKELRETKNNGGNKPSDYVGTSILELSYYMN